MAAHCVRGTATTLKRSVTSILMPFSSARPKTSLSMMSEICFTSILLSWRNTMISSCKNRKSAVALGTSPPRGCDKNKTARSSGGQAGGMASQTKCKEEEGGEVGKFVLSAYQTVEELRAEVLLELFVDKGLNTVVAVVLSGSCVQLEAEATSTLLDDGGADVGGHDKQHVLKIDRAPLHKTRSDIFFDIRPRKKKTTE